MTGLGTDWWLDANGVRMFVRCWRPGGAPRGLAVLVHGIGEHAGRYAPVVAGLTGMDFVVVAPDLRGHGRSSGLRGHAASVDELVADINEVLAEASLRFPGGPRLAYGHSMGGAIVLLHALRFPGAAAARVVTAPAIRPAFVPPRWKVAVGRLARRVVPALSLRNEVDPSGLSHDEAVVRAYRADPLVHARVSAALGIGLLGLEAGLLSQAPGLRGPVLVVHGGLDPIVSAGGSREFAHRAGAACAYREVPGAYHEVHHEASWPDTWRTISAWLETAVGRGAATTRGH